MTTCALLLFLLLSQAPSGGNASAPQTPADASSVGERDPAAAPTAAAPAAPLDEVPDALRRASFNVDSNGLALQGYDPVWYVVSAGKERGTKDGARKGSAAITSTWRGITYRFATESNKAIFDADPARYEPPYGGWCAWAVIDGDKVEVDPENYRIIDGKVYLFYKGWLGNARNDWDKLVARLTTKGAVKEADAGWSKLAHADAEAYAKDHPEWKRKTVTP